MSIEISDYTAEELIFESDNSLVYRARRKQGAEKAIIKVLKQDFPSARELIRYNQEYRLARSLDAPNIIRALGLQKHQNTLAILFEDFGGDSLRSLLFIEVGLSHRGIGFVASSRADSFIFVEDFGWRLQRLLEPMRSE